MGNRAIRDVKSHQGGLLVDYITIRPFRKGNLVVFLYLYFCIFFFCIYIYLIFFIIKYFLNNNNISREYLKYA